ncbi:MAG: S41 family peptidase [Hyphomicrobiaceae bacterium]|nr:S41 family peptidase [Hyphomicrobiaceae bacterium]
MAPTIFKRALLASVFTAFSLTLPVLPAGAQDSGQTDAAQTDAGPASFDGRSSDEIYSDLQLFGEVFDRIRSEYVDVPDERQLIRAAIEGMLSSLDPHSGYLPPDAYESVRQDTSGEFGGLGVEITMEEGIVRVMNPIKDTPAFRAGILANDYIIALDDIPILGRSLDETINQMKGKVGTPIKVTVVREGVAEPFDVELDRGFIPVKAVRWRMQDGVALMRLDSFSEQAFNGIRDAIHEVIDEGNGELPKGIILDLRNNPGGLVDQAVYVADAFLSQGAIVMTRGRNPDENERYDAHPDDLDALIKDVPVIILINGGTASAAEILSGALQDQKRATIIGTRSFGKGSVQLIIGLGTNGAMRLTIARYYTPSNRSIQASGIQPDIVIQQNVPEEFQGRDEVVGEAALAGQIGGGSDAEATSGSSTFVPADPEKDTQLNYAIDLILGKETNPAYPPDPNS